MATTCEDKLQISPSPALFRLLSSLVPGGKECVAPCVDCGIRGDKTTFSLQKGQIAVDAIIYDTVDSD